MKKLTKYLFIIATLNALMVYSQVGINTNNPQEALHVAGSTSTIRVDGLNSANDSNNYGGTDIYNLMVDEMGNMVLSEQSGLLLTGSQIGTPIPLQSTSMGGLNDIELYQENFMLSQRAIVIITYNIGIEFASFDGLSSITDGRAKVAHNYFYLGDGTTANNSTAYGMTSNVYANATLGAASDQIYNSHTEFIVLDPGNYSIHMYGAVFGGGLNSDAAFRAIFGNGDRIDVSVIYL